MSKRLIVLMFVVLLMASLFTGFAAAETLESHKPSNITWEKYLIQPNCPLKLVDTLAPNGCVYKAIYTEKAAYWRCEELQTTICITSMFLDNRETTWLWVYSSGNQMVENLTDGNARTVDPNTHQIGSIAVPKYMLDHWLNLKIENGEMSLVFE